MGVGKRWEEGGVVVGVRGSILDMRVTRRNTRLAGLCGGGANASLL